MCCENCCYTNSSLKTLKFILIIFTVFNIIISLISLFIRASKTERYKDALVLLEQRNNGSYKKFVFDTCYMGGTFKNDKYCIINGTSLYKPSEKVEYQSLFKNYINIETITDILRLIFTIIYLIFSYYINSKYKKFFSNLPYQEQDKERENFGNLLLISIAFLSLLILISIICLLIRVFALTANMDIGLYEEGKQNEFESRTAVNYIIDIAYIVLNSISIGLVLRIKNSLYPKEEKKPIQPPADNIKSNTHINYPQNPSLHKGRIFLPPINYQVNNIQINQFNQVNSNENYGVLNIQN